jgi:hypothetical protein
VFTADANARIAKPDVLKSDHMRLAQVRTLITLLLLCAPRLTRGDGGVVQLHEGQGPFLVTVFVPSEVVRGQSADLSVLVQARENGEPVLDADVSLALDPASGSTMNQSDPLCGPPPMGVAALPFPNPGRHLVTVGATHQQASNKLLYAAPVELKAAGNWRLHVLVSRGSVSAVFDCVLPVNPASAQLRGLWPCLAFPPIAIGAFVINQMLRRSSLERL